MKPRMHNALALLLLVAPTWAQAQGSPANRRQYAYVWAGAADSTQSDFLAVVDVTQTGTRYGGIIATVPVNAVTMAHHIEMASRTMLLANGFESGQTFRFEVQNPAHPTLASSLAVPDSLAHPHSFVRLPNGHVLATYQYHRHNHSRPGGLAEHDGKGDVVRWKTAEDPAVDEFVRPYSLVVMPALDRVVSTGVDMHGQGKSRVVQVWRLSNLTLIKSIVLPNGPRGDEGWQTFEPRILADDRTVIVSTLQCGLYRIDGLEGDDPTASHIYTFDDQRCDMPAVIGRYWIQTLSTTHAIVTLDVSDPARPVEVARLDLGADNRPHWIAVEPGGNRMLLTGYRGLQFRLLMLRLDSATGAVAVDTAFREDDSAESGINFNRPRWSQPGIGVARPHGAIFAPR